jgi:hypothetical protein
VGNGLTVNHAKEALSYAFMTALAAQARVSINIGETFDYGVDGHWREIKRCPNGRHVANGLTLEFQLKATVNWTEDPGDTHIVYNCEVKAYNDIASRAPEENGLVLIVLCLPQDETQWVQATPDVLKLKHCCYWYKVDGAAVPKQDTQREKIYIPKTNLLDESALKKLLKDERSRRLAQTT